MTMRLGLQMTALTLIGKLPIHKLRVLSLRFAGARIDDDVTLYHGYSVRAPKRLSIGANTSIGDNAVLDARGGLEIGRSVNISTAVQIWTAQHDWRAPDFGYVERSVRIEGFAWIGPRVIVLPGATIGEGAVIGAGSVVSGAIAPWGLYAGSPAKRIADRPGPMSYRLGSPKDKPWFW